MKQGVKRAGRSMAVPRVSKKGHGRRGHKMNHLMRKKSK